MSESSRLATTTLARDSCNAFRLSMAGFRPLSGELLVEGSSGSIGSQMLPPSRRGQSTARYQRTPTLPSEPVATGQVRQDRQVRAGPALAFDSGKSRIVPP